MAHGDSTRPEYKVTIRGWMGIERVEWRLTEEAAEALREKNDVISIERAVRVLDF